MRMVFDPLPKLLLLSIYPFLFIHARTVVVGARRPKRTQAIFEHEEKIYNLMR